MIKIVGVSTSPSDASVSRNAVSTMLRAAEKQPGVRTELLDIRRGTLPLYSPNYANARAHEIRQKIREADGVILASPVYHGSYTAGFKNFIEWTAGDGTYKNKPVALVNAAGGAQGGPVPLNHMRDVMDNLHADVFNGKTAVGGDKVDGRKGITDNGTRSRLETIGQHFAEHVSRLKAFNQGRKNAS